MKHSTRMMILSGAAVCLLGLHGLTAAAADEHEHGGFGGRDRAFGREAGHIDGRGQVLDSRYNHGRYYPPVGTAFRALPGGYRPYYFHGSPYYFADGIWYGPGPGGFLVIRPPVGLVISVLPPYYSTIWVGGLPYYYANNVYYTWDPAQNGYTVVDPPPGADQPSQPPSQAKNDMIIYPKNGQTTDQQAADRYECHSWAKGQTGFDPTQPAGGVAPASSDQARANYNRAMSACLQARGYQVN